MRPSFVAAATMSLSLSLKITGPEVNSAFGAVNQSFSSRVFGSSATMALA